MKIVSINYFDADSSIFNRRRINNFLFSTNFSIILKNPSNLLKSSFCRIYLDILGHSFHKIGKYLENILNFGLNFRQVPTWKMQNESNFSQKNLYFRDFKRFCFLLILATKCAQINTLRGVRYEKWKVNRSKWLKTQRKGPKLYAHVYVHACAHLTLRYVEAGRKPKADDRAIRRKKDVTLHKPFGFVYRTPFGGPVT